MKEFKLGLNDIVKSKGKVLLAGTPFVAAVAIVACGGGGEGSGASTNPPTATESRVTPVISEVPTIAPTPEYTIPFFVPDGWSEEILAEKIELAEGLVFSVTELKPDSEIVGTVKEDFKTAIEQFNQMTESQNYESALDFFNRFGNIGYRIGQEACMQQSTEIDGKAWVAMEELTLGLSGQFEKSGYLENGITETFKTYMFGVPENCINEVILASRN